MLTDIFAPLYIVGLGPGDPRILTFQAMQTLEACKCLAGYELYLDLLEPRIKEGKVVVGSGMRQERQRCAAAIDMSMGGTPTAIVCSGDGGIYAMASLALEIMVEKQVADTLPFEVIPGVPALCAAAALLGAPLSHDFACISLSDLLTPRELIERRLHAALGADFVCVLYNPRSHGRPGYLRMALDIALQYRTPACPVGMVKNAFRAGQEVVKSTLGAFAAEKADMLSLVIIGNSQSRMCGTHILTPRGYGQKYGGCPKA